MAILLGVIQEKQTFLRKSCSPLNYLYLLNVAYSSLGSTKVLYATYFLLLGAKAKFLTRKPNVLVALEEISGMC